MMNEMMERGASPEYVNREIRNRKKKGNKYRKRRRKVILFLLLFCAFLFLFGKVYYWGAPGEIITEVNGITINRILLPEDIPGRPGTERRIKYIVVHETGNRDVGACAHSHHSYINKEACEKPLSWHYTIDKRSIYQHIPDEEVAFHAGSRDGNKHGIGIEICVNADGDYEKSLENAAALVRRLMKIHRLRITDVRTHHDFSGKNCPEILLESGSWEDFLQMVKESG